MATITARLHYVQCRSLPYIYIYISLTLARESVRGDVACCVSSVLLFVCEMRFRCCLLIGNEQ